MEIRSYNKHTLPTLIQSAEFAQWQSIPISTHRAISQSHNPLAGDNDILLSIALDEGNLIGYMGFIPCVMKLYDDELSPFSFAWVSGVWVSPLSKSKGIFNKLLKTGLHYFQQRLIVTDYTKQAAASFMRSGAFFDDFQLKGYRYYLRSNINEILPNKNPQLAPFQPFLKIIDLCINRFAPLFLSKIIPSYSNHFNIISKLDEICIVFLKDYCNAMQIQHLLWIQNYPWILHSLENNINAKYYFSHCDTSFYSFYIVENNENNINSITQITIRNGILKIIYHYGNSTDSKFLAYKIYQLANDYNVTCIVSYDHSINNALLGNIKFIYIKSSVKPFLYTEEIKDYLSKIELQQGDGDSAFF